MSNLQDVVALNFAGRDVSLAECLRRLKVADALIDAFRPIIEELIVEQAAQERGLTITHEELQGLADAYRSEHGLYKADETRDWLEDVNLSIEEFEQRLRHRSVRDLLKEAVTAGQVEPWFAEHRTTFDAAELSHILVRERTVAEELAAQIREEAADFAELARRHSEDDATRALGGRIGGVNRDELSPALQAAVFSDRRGGIVGPVAVDGGWAVVRVDELHLGELDDDVRAEIANQLFDQWMAEQYERAGVHLPLLDLL